ncbi:MAG: SufE family protein [Geminicoccaceae bacterium]|nr:MAG: SufE family protein [Geminicoccaceae bacterium]
MAEATIQDEERAIEEEFALFDEWRDKIDYVMDLGRNLKPFPAASRTEANKVHGCQSQVWMVAHVDPRTGRLHLDADSDAILVKGLIGLLMRLYDDRPPAEIVATPPTVFDRVGLGRHLTPGRANGLHAMIRRVRELAAAQA